MKTLKSFLVIGFAVVMTATAGWAATTKKGVLVTEACVEQGRFVECPLTTYTQDAKLVLFVHEDLTYYTLDVSKISQRELDEGFARNGVEITGELNPGKNLLVAEHYKAPPPPAASSFKG